MHRFDVLTHKTNSVLQQPLATMESDSVAVKPTVEDMHSGTALELQSVSAISNDVEDGGGASDVGEVVVVDGGGGDDDDDEYGDADCVGEGEGGLKDKSKRQREGEHMSCDAE